MFAWVKELFSKPAVRPVTRPVQAFPQVLQDYLDSKTDEAAISPQQLLRKRVNELIKEWNDLVDAVIVEDKLIVYIPRPAQETLSYKLAREIFCKKYYLSAEMSTLQHDCYLLTL